jgi:pyridoxamine 5'-phosphate oxidase
MIKFCIKNNDDPYVKFREKYYDAAKASQQNIEAIAISSFDKELNEVDSRFVNLKYIDDRKFIFFTNYNSPKSKAFQSHSKISALIYWSSIDTQIRMKADIKKTTKDFNNFHFKDRSINKNALAISSNQSKHISSYENVIENYQNVLNKNKELSICPDYWGGYFFIPYYFEFWEGNDSRLNKREVYELKENKWIKGYLEP